MEFGLLLQHLARFMNVFINSPRMGNKPLVSSRGAVKSVLEFANPAINQYVILLKSTMLKRLISQFVLNFSISGKIKFPL